MADYLTENARFRCSQGGRITCKDSGNRTVRYGGVPLLTTGATVRSKMGVCAALTSAAGGVTQLCQCQLTAWSNPKGNVFRGNSLLTAASFNSCAMAPGGIIRVADSGVFGRCGEGSTASLESISTLPRIEEKKTARAGTKITAAATGMGAVGASTAVAGEGGCEATAASAIDKEAPKLAFRCVRCGRGCQPWTDADPNTLHMTDDGVDNNAIKLRKKYYDYLAALAGDVAISDRLSNCEDENFYADLLERIRPKCRKADEIYLDSCKTRIRRKKEGLSSWLYAAHHILSGNQVLAAREKGALKFPKCVQVANIMGFDPEKPERRLFDVNEADNCIMLVTNEKGDGVREDFLKTVSAFDAMSLTGLQWHAGPHNYTLGDDAQAVKEKMKLYLSKQRLEKAKRRGDIETEVGIGEYLRNEESIKDYETLLQGWLREVEYGLTLTDICPRGFLTRLRRKMDEVRGYLEAFHGKPHRSFPYYVSKEAFLYAFKLPRKVKVITARRMEKGLVFERFKATRYGETQQALGKNMAFIPSGDAHVFHDCNALALFCENAEHFVLMGAAEEKNVPFSMEFCYRLEDNGAKTQEILQQNDSKLLVWLRDNPSEHYTAIAKKVAERIGGETE